MADALEAELQASSAPNGALDPAVQAHLAPYRAASVAAEYLAHLSAIRKRRACAMARDEQTMTFDDSLALHEHLRSGHNKETSA